MSRSLPRSVDDLDGLRAAGWIRESTREQYDNFGPDAQETRIARAIDRYGLRDTKLRFDPEDGVSGSNAWRHPEMQRMLGSARAGAFDVLIVAYTDRFARNVKATLDLIEDGLHPVNVALVVADRRLLSSDPDDYHDLVDEANAAQKVITQLSRKIKDGYEAKFERYADQAGNAPLGFRRVPREVETRRNGEPIIRKFLQVDSTEIGTIVSIFERYATGLVSIEQLAFEHGLGVEQVRKALQNPIYNGFVRRLRGPHEVRQAAPWRTSPPVSDLLWQRVQEVRGQRQRGGGPRRTDRADPLRGVLFCASCGTRIRSDGTMGTPPRRAKLHPGTCAGWGTKARRSAVQWEEPILQQLGGISLSQRTIEAVVEALTATTPPVTSISNKVIEREKERLARDFGQGRLTVTEFADKIAMIGDAVPIPEPPTVDAAQAVEWLKDLRRLIRAASPASIAELVSTVYERIEVTGTDFKAVHLTPAAMAHGLALALPETVSVHWRPRQDSNLRPSA